MPAVLLRPIVLFTAAFSLAALLVGTSGCKDQGKESANRAAEHAAMLVQLVDKDVAEVERGLPEGARRLGTLVAKGADPRQDLPAVRRALMKIRREVMDLNVAKSTFFALADDNGVAIRNDLEEDAMAGQNLAQFFPAILEAKERGYAATVGAFPNAATKAGPDKDWIAAAPVKREDGSTGALLVTGWSYRYFARHLYEALKGHLIEEAKASGNEGKLPVFYVAIFDTTGVYGAPLTPAINEQTLAAQDLVPKTANGTFQGVVTITNRTFGFAAARTPKMAPDTGVVVMRSEI